MITALKLSIFFLSFSACLGFVIDRGAYGRFPWCSVVVLPESSSYIYGKRNSSGLADQLTQSCVEVDGVGMETLGVN